MWHVNCSKLSFHETKYEHHNTIVESCCKSLMLTGRDAADWRYSRPASFRHGRLSNKTLRPTIAQSDLRRNRCQLRNHVEMMLYKRCSHQMHYLNAKRTSLLTHSFKRP